MVVGSTGRDPVGKGSPEPPGAEGEPGKFDATPLTNVDGSTGSDGEAPPTGSWEVTGLITLDGSTFDGSTGRDEVGTGSPEPPEPTGRAPGRLDKTGVAIVEGSTGRDPEAPGSEGETGKFDATRLITDEGSTGSEEESPPMGSCEVTGLITPEGTTLVGSTGRDEVGKGSPESPVPAGKLDKTGLAI